MSDPCGKMAFETRAAAKAWVRSLQRGRHAVEAPRAKETYRCRHCGLWHLTSQSKTEQRRHARRVRQGADERRDD